MSRIHTRGGGFLIWTSYVQMCAYVPVYLRVSVCVRIHMVRTTRIWEYMRQRLRWFPKSPTHQVAPQQTNKDSWISMFKGVVEKRRKIFQCELAKAGNRLTIVSVSWFTPLCKSQQFSPVSIALNNSQQFPNLRFPTIFANLRFSSPQIGAQASRHGKQEHFDPH